MTADEFSAVLCSACGVAPGDHILAAVSGGADSVALLALLREAANGMGLKISCAHVEHGIRGGASMEDMAFVRELCGRWDIPFYGCSVDAPGYAREHGCGMEDAARRLRYDYLENTAQEIGAAHIALAHHLLDQAETVLLHAIRGSGLRGLGAMRMRRGRLVRPLLHTQPQELRDYLVSIGQPWREDETNQSDIYLRNRIRLDVTPRLQAACPGAERALARLALSAQRDEDYIQAQLDGLPVCHKMIPLADGAAVSIEYLAGLHDALKSRAIVRLMERAKAEEISAAGVRRIMEALEEKTAAVPLGGGVLARIEAGYLCITREGEQVPDTRLSAQGETLTPFGVFRVRDALPGETGDGVFAQVMPAELLENASVGARRPGETMIPFGRRTPVKLKKLMIDAGVPRAMRRSVPIIRNGEIVLWAAGLRPAEGCRGDESKKRKIVEFCAEGNRPCAQDPKEIQQDSANCFRRNIT